MTRLIKRDGTERLGFKWAQESPRAFFPRDRALREESISSPLGPVLSLVGERMGAETRAEPVKVQWALEPLASLHTVIRSVLDRTNRTGLTFPSHLFFPPTLEDDV